MSPVFEDLSRYETTTHVSGQSTITLDGATATGESYAIAHHVYIEDGGRDWSETRPMTAAAPA